MDPIYRPLHKQVMITVRTGCATLFSFVLLLHGHRREHHPEAALQASGTGTAGSSIQRLFCRLREWAPPEAPFRGCSAGFGNGHRWEHHPEAALRLRDCLHVGLCITGASATPPLHVDCFRFLYAGVMVWAGDQQPTTQKPNLAHYFCFIILFYVIYFFK